MPKWCKTIIALLLLPACVGAGQALGQVLRASGRADTFWVALGAGALCWVVVFLMLPRPMWLYVFGHELTHVLWTWLFGGSVKKFKVTSGGGHVMVTKTNFLIALAPYFFPIYVLAIVFIFAVGQWWWNWRAYQVWFHLLLGAAYAFHLTLTWQILQTRQSDITGQGYLFSAVVIFLGNVGVLLLGLPWLTAQVNWFMGLRWWLENTGAIWQQLGRLILPR